MQRQCVCLLVTGFHLWSWLKSGQIRIKSLISVGWILILFSHDSAKPDSRSVSGVCVSFPSGVIVGFPADCMSSWRSRLPRSEVDECRFKHRRILVVMRRESRLYIYFPSTCPTPPFFSHFSPKLLCQSCDVTHRYDYSLWKLRCR